MFFIIFANVEINRILFLSLIISAAIPIAFADQTDHTEFETRATLNPVVHTVNIKSNLLPWLATIPNIGIEYTFSQKISANLDLWYCPWKITDKHSVKTVQILPEVRWWLKDYSKGSYFNIHLTCGWYNIRWGDNRFQDADTPMLGAGIGYGYKLELNRKWAFEFTIGAGYFHTRCDKFYNLPNGALINTRNTSYFGIDRLGVNVVYNIGDL